MKKTLIIIWILLPFISYAGITIPPKSMTGKISIGLIRYNSNSCLQELNYELRYLGYKVKNYDIELESPKDFLDKRGLDYLISANTQKVNMLVREYNYFHKVFDLETYYSCRSIIRQINEITLGERPSETIRFKSQEEEKSVHEKGIEAYNKNRFNEAIMFFEELMIAEPDNVDSYYFLSQIYKSQGRHDLEIEYLKKAESLNPLDKRTAIGIGNHFLYEEKYDAATEYYSSCLADIDNKYPALFNLGLIAELSNSKEKAKSFFKEIPQSNPLYGKAQKRIFKLNKIEKKQSYLPYFIFSILGLLLLGVFFSRRKKLIENPLILKEDDLSLIKSNIAKGHIDKAIEKVKFHSEKTNKFIHRQILSIESRWNQIKNQENKGVRNSNEIQIEKNKIIDSILNIIN